MHTPDNIAGGVTYLPVWFRNETFLPVHGEESEFALKLVCDPVSEKVRMRNKVRKRHSLAPAVSPST
jgi:hypothetical protein